MPRIRTIKPEFWDSPGTARASLRARLFFIAMWNWADDYGVGTANPKQLVGFAFPNDDDVTVAEFPRLRAEVSDCYGVQWYEVENRPYYYIPSWDDHQKNERRAKGKFPRPDQGILIDTEIPREAAVVQALEQGNRGTGEQGNRGTGEQGNRGTDTPVGGEQSSPPKKPVDPQEKLINDVAKYTYEQIGKSANFMALRGIAKWCLNERGVDGNQFCAAVVEVYRRGKPITRQTIGQCIDGHLKQGGGQRQSRAEEANDFIARLEAMDAAGGGGEAFADRQELR